jgi:NhaD family Na+/H+ antiporter
MNKYFLKAAIFFFLSILSFSTYAASIGGETLDLTNHLVGYVSILVFIIAYSLVMSEEVIHLKKSKPVLVSAGLIWFGIAWVYSSNNLPHAAEVAVRHNILEFAELMLFLLVAMTYVNALLERHVFEALRSYLVSKNYSFRKLFWITGIIAFFLSPIADNLTTALVMCAVILAVGGDNRKFILIGCINIVVAANAGGAFSPFGDITTLMVWQKGIVTFSEFFALVLPSVVNYLVPAVIMQFAVSKGVPEAIEEKVEILPGGIVIIFLFLATIVTAVSAHNFFHLPPALGMMLGLGYLMFYSYYLTFRHKGTETDDSYGEINIGGIGFQQKHKTFDPFHRIAGAEWDTLLFFFGVILSVGGLGFIGYLSLVSETMYIGWGPTWANIMVGVLSAIVDNIPVMFAVLTMNPDMSLNQWLLVTLTAGVGGSMLSVGSAAGVALMGQSKGIYTFLGHLKWTPVIALGYVASIITHILINGL